MASRGIAACQWMCSFFGAHPDDVEWGAGGIALLLRNSGVSFAIVDMTEGELGSRGTPEERKAEAALAAEFMGAQARENLGLPDGGIQDTTQQVVDRKHNQALSAENNGRTTVGRPPSGSRGRRANNSKLSSVLRADESRRSKPAASSPGLLLLPAP